MCKSLQVIDSLFFVLLLVFSMAHRRVCIKLSCSASCGYFWSGRYCCLMSSLLSCRAKFPLFHISIPCTVHFGCGTTWDSHGALMGFLRGCVKLAVNAALFPHRIVGRVKIKNTSVRRGGSWKCGRRKSWSSLDFKVCWLLSSLPLLSSSVWFRF